MNEHIRDVNSLVNAMQEGYRPKWVFFWGHQPARDGSTTKSCFSQWWQGASFELAGVRYATAEHFMMAEKARLFGDSETAARIVAAKHPGEAKKLGRLVAGFEEEPWQQARFGIVVAGNLAKFKQNPTLAEFLAGTGERILVEASPRDRIWGIGMAANDGHADNPGMWKGLNLLGFALMEVRHQLTEGEPSSVTHVGQPIR